MSFNRVKTFEFAIAQRHFEEANAANTRGLTLLFHIVRAIARRTVFNKKTAPWVKKAP